MKTPKSPEIQGFLSDKQRLLQTIKLKHFSTACFNVILSTTKREARLPGITERKNGSHFFCIK